jgi:hypothetical protein
MKNNTELNEKVLHSVAKILVVPVDEGWIGLGGEIWPTAGGQ